MDSQTAIVVNDGRSAAARGAVDAKSYGPDRLDDLDEDVREGRIRRVVFPRPANLYDGIWNQEIDFAAWLDRGVTIEFVDGRPDDVRTIVECWQRWNRARRRRNAVAGAILSAVALIACFALQMLLRR